MELNPADQQITVAATRTHYCTVLYLYCTLSPPGPIRLDQLLPPSLSFFLSSSDIVARPHELHCGSPLLPPVVESPPHPQCSGTNFNTHMSCAHL